MTTVVPTTDDQPALSVVRFITELAWADAGQEVADVQVDRLYSEAHDSMAAGRWLELASLMLTSAELVFSNPKLSDKDLDCIFTVICTLVTKPESIDETHEIAKLICSKMIQHPTDKPSLRIKILFNLYNMLENPFSRFYVYMNVLDLALMGKIPEHVIPSIKKIESFLKEWNLDIKDQRKLFLSLSNVLKEGKSSPKDAFKFLTKYLATFTGEDPNVITTSKEEAVRTVIEFIKTPDIFQCELLDLPSVSQLEKDAAHSLVYQLLKIFLTRRLDAYTELYTAKQSELKNYGLVHEDCMTKMRLLSLVDLASNGSRISYDVIKDTLQVIDEEVELWIVRAITSKLIDGKMDQTNRVLVVSRSMHRVFGQQQWKDLKTKLSTWRGNVTNVINTIQANKLTEDGSQAMQGLMMR